MDIIVGEVASRLSEHGVSLTLTDAARDKLASDGYDRTYGARPLRREVQRAIENPLSRAILAGEFADGDRAIGDVDQTGAITFAKAASRLMEKVPA